MAKQPTQARRKLVGFDEETWHALNLLSRESMKTFQELADVAFRNLLQKYGRPTDSCKHIAHLTTPTRGGDLWIPKMSFHPCSKKLAENRFGP